MVVVDDGSTDETHEILARYEGRREITILRIDGRGLAAAGNAGIAACPSEWILRLDADDWLEPDALRILYRHATHSGADFVYGDLHLVDEFARDLGVLSQAEEWTGSSMERTPVGSGALYRRVLWEKIGGYDESLRYQEDFDFWLKGSEQFRTSHIAQPVYVYRQHFSSMSSNRTLRSASRELVKRRALERRGLGGEDVLAVISVVPPLSARIDPGACMLSLGGETLIDRLHQRLLQAGSNLRIAVVCGSSEIARWADTRGLRVVDGHASFVLHADPYTHLAAELTGEADVLLFVSPYYPLLESYRFNEALETLLLGGYARVDTAIPDSSPVLVPANGAWQALPSVAAAACLPGAMRMAGGLSAFRPAASGSRRGCVEIMWPEDHVVRNRDMLHAAEFMQRALTACR